MFQAGLLAGKHILVTGGGTGLGAAMARRFAELGADLVLCGRRRDVVEEAAARLTRDHGTHIFALRCDLRDPKAVEAMLDEIWRIRPLDILVNNAAGNFIAQTHRLSHRAIDAVLAPTLNGAIYTTFGAGRRWIDAGRGGVVLSILSTSTITGRAFTVPSAIAKSGLLAMTRSLAVEWGPRGIRLVGIAPGPIPTSGAVGRLHPEEREATSAINSRNPLSRTGTTDELANLASFLVSDHAGYINGDMVVMDGGQHLRTSGAEDLLTWSDAEWSALRERVKSSNQGQ